MVEIGTTKPVLLPAPAETIPITIFLPFLSTKTGPPEFPCSNPVDVVRIYPPSASPSRATSALE